MGKDLGRQPDKIGGPSWERHSFSGCWEFRLHCSLSSGSSASYDKTAQGKGREYIKGKQAILSEVVEAGRTVRQCERERLAGEKRCGGGVHRH